MMLSVGDIEGRKIDGPLCGRQPERPAHRALARSRPGPPSPALRQPTRARRRSGVSVVEEPAPVRGPATGVAAHAAGAAVVTAAGHAAGPESEHAPWCPARGRDVVFFGDTAAA